MTPERWRIQEEILLAAWDAPPQARDATVHGDAGVVTGGNSIESQGASPLEQSVVVIWSCTSSPRLRRRSGSRVHPGRVSVEPSFNG